MSSNVKEMTREELEQRIEELEETVINWKRIAGIIEECKQVEQLSYAFRGEPLRVYKCPMCCHEGAPSPVVSRAHDNARYVCCLDCGAILDFLKPEAPDTAQPGVAPDGPQPAQSEPLGNNAGHR